MATDRREIFKKFPLIPHHEIGEVFVDQLGTSFFDGTTLRLELIATRMSEPKPPAQPSGEPHVVGRLVLSAACAIDLINRMQSIAAQLTNAGLVKTGPQPPPPPPPSETN